MDRLNRLHPVVACLLGANRRLAYVLLRKTRELKPERSPHAAPPSFQDQVAADKARLEKHKLQSPGWSEKGSIAQKIRQLETASHISDWLSSPELKPPH